VADNDVIRVSLSYERTTKETIDNAFKILKTMTEHYKKHKDDPSLLKPESMTKLMSSREVPITADAEFEIKVPAPPQAVEPPSTSASIPSAAQSQTTKPEPETSSKTEPSKSTEISSTKTQKPSNPPRSKTPPPPPSRVPKPAKSTTPKKSLPKKEPKKQ
ncbi:hypothetical protein COOONC_20703, partial [Cooperia oncophora]